MADSSVSFLLDKLNALLQEEVNLQSGFCDDVQHIKNELERHKAILRDADAMEDKDPEHKAWVREVRDVAYHMEDAIDEFNCLLAVQHGQSSNGSSSQRLEEADLVGIHKPKKQLCDLPFNEEPERAVIQIYGKGGLGKTPLAKQVYDHPKIKKRCRIHRKV